MLHHLLNVCCIFTFSPSVITPLYSPIEYFIQLNSAITFAHHNDRYFQYTRYLESSIFAYNMDSLFHLYRSDHLRLTLLYLLQWKAWITCWFIPYAWLSLQLGWGNWWPIWGGWDRIVRYWSLLSQYIEGTHFKFCNFTKFLSMSLKSDLFQVKCMVICIAITSYVNYFLC